MIQILNFLTGRMVFCCCALLVVLVEYTAVEGTGWAADLQCFNNGWPSEYSDLEPDNSIVRGYLENGMRYVIRTNKEPENRVAIFLYINAGSLHEQEQERGAAHFLEHLIFNGSENFPAGSLIDHLQDRGMDFGQDTNAYTSFDKTVYQLILPNGEESDLNEGMNIIADFARGALLDPVEIEKERGVIFSEKKERDSARYRIQVASSAFAFRGTRYPKRMVIGVDETLKKADRTLLKRFYDAWYRPENMSLVVVGDLEPKIAKKVIETSFSTLQANGEKPACPEFGKLQHKGIETFYYFEPELGHTNVAVESFWEKALEDDSKAMQNKELIQIMSNLIVGYRFQKMQEEKQLPFVNGSYHSGNILNRIGYGSFAVQTEGKSWKQALGEIVELQKQLVVYGVSEKERQRAAKEVLAELVNNVKTYESLDSRVVAGRIINHLGSNRVYMNARQELELYGPMVEAVTVDDINHKYRSVWANSSRLVSVTGDVKVPEDTKEKILHAYNQSMAVSVEAPDDKDDDEFPYLAVALPKKGDVEENDLAGIDASRYVLPNGVVINMKETNFENNIIRFAVVFGNGELESELPGEALIVEDVINYSGTNTLAPSAIDTILAGSSVRVNFGIGGAMFTWTGSTLAKDFELSQQLLHTLLLDKGFRKIAYDKVLRGVGLMYERLQHEIRGALPLKIQPFLADNSIHFGLPKVQDVENLTYEELNDWVQKKLNINNLEISIVGDFKKSKVLDILVKYFGGIELKNRAQPAKSIIDFPAGEKLEVKVESSIKKSLVTVAWPTDDFWNISRTRRLNVLAKIFEERLRKKVREEMGVSYSPQVSYFGSRVFKGYGYILAELTVQQGTEANTIEQIKRINEHIYLNGVTTEEVEKVKKPLITAIKESIKTNNYWLYSVLLGSSRHPVQLQWPITLIDDIKSITADDVNAFAKKYLLQENAAVAVAFPEKTDDINNSDDFKQEIENR